MWYRCCVNIPPRPLDDKSQAEGELKRKYGYATEEKIFGPMKRFRSRKRSELNEVEKKKQFFGEEVMVEEERERELSRCGVGHADGRGGGKTCGRDDQWR